MIFIHSASNSLRTCIINISHWNSAHKIGTPKEISHRIYHKREGNLHIYDYTHCIAKIHVIRFWKVELSPTYNKDLSIVKNVDSISLTIKIGRLNYPIICEFYTMLSLSSIFILRLLQSIFSYLELNPWKWLDFDFIITYHWFCDNLSWKFIFHL